MLQNTDAEHILKLVHPNVEPFTLVVEILIYVLQICQILTFMFRGSSEGFQMGFRELQGASKGGSRYVYVTPKSPETPLKRFSNRSKPFATSVTLPKLSVIP